MMKVLIVLAFIVLFGLSNGQNPEPKTTTSTTTTSTTEAPKTTTPSSTTTSTPSTTTTTTTTVKPTPMPTPAKASNPPVVAYNLTDAGRKDVVCLMAQMAAQLVFTYKNEQNVSETAYINLMNSTTATGTCHNDSSSLVLSINGNPKNLLTLTVERDAGVDLVDQVLLNFTLNDKDFPLHPNVSALAFKASNLTLFKSQTGKSYVCNSKAEMKLGVDQNVSVVLELSNVKFDAFRTQPNTGFQEGQVCRADDEVSDIVPIAVGIALVSLVVVVLVAYFIGRRRSRRMAYQSV